MQVADIEQQRQIEQERLDSQKSSKERNRLGQFATPPGLAREIASYAFKNIDTSVRSISFLDPAVGTGSFYSALREEISGIRVERAVGIEIDSVHADAARSLWSETGLQVETDDFTKLSHPTKKFNLVLTNPPYVRHHHLSSFEKVRLQGLIKSNCDLDISGLAGLYAYFLLLCDSWLAEGGLAAWLIPSEFMDVNYGAAIRKYLTDKVSLIHIHRFSPADVQFCDALVSSAIVFFRKRPVGPRQSAIFSYGGSLLGPETKQLVSLSSLRRSRKWTRFPMPQKRSHQTENTIRLSALFLIKRGIATGSNKFFIIPKQEALRKGIPEEFLRPILPSPRFLASDVVTDNGRGYPNIDPQLSVIDCPLDEKDIQMRHPEFWSYLQSGVEKGIHLGYLTSRRQPWYSQEKRVPAPYLCTYMGRCQKRRNPFRLIWNQSQAIAPNVYLMLIPKASLGEVLDRNPELCGSIFEILRNIDSRHFMSEGRVYGGGLYKIEPKELGRISAAPFLRTIEHLDCQEQLNLSFAR